MMASVAEVMVMMHPKSYCSSQGWNVGHIAGHILGSDDDLGG